MEQYTQTLWPNWAYAASEEPFPTRMQLSPYASCFADSMEAAYQNHQQHLVHHHQMSRTTESKPRLSKEEVEILEAEFQKNHKPNSTTKKALAESMRVENARINVRFPPSFLGHVWLELVGILTDHAASELVSKSTSPREEGE